MQHNSSKKISEIIIAVVAWSALVLQLWLMLKNAKSIGFTTTATLTNFFSYFTILSNLLVAVSCSARSDSFFAGTKTRSAIALYIFIVGLVYNLVLRSLWHPTGSQLLADNLLHVVVPVVYLIYWFVFTPKKVLTWKDILPWLIFPLIYLVYSLVRGPIAHWYPYPFLDVDKHGFGKVLLNAFFVLLAFLVVGMGLIAVNRRGKAV